MTPEAESFIDKARRLLDEAELMLSVNLSGAAGRTAYLAGFHAAQALIAERTTSFTELRRSLASTLDRVTQDHEPVIITRDRGKPSAVLISLGDFASYEETRYLLQSPKNAERLLDAVGELDTDRGSERTLAE